MIQACNPNVAAVVMVCAVFLGVHTCDGKVDVNDLLIVINNWGTCPSSGPCPGDLNGDGVVDVNDMLVVINNWGYCDAGSGESFGGNSSSSESGPQDVLELLQSLPEIPQEVIEEIETLLGL